MKLKENILIASLYAVIVIGFGFWWAENFTNYVRFKGDESLFEIAAVGIFTICTAAIFKLINPEVSWWFTIAMPLLVGLLSILVTLFMPFIEGTTVNNLRVYGVVHSLLAIVTAYWLTFSSKRKTDHRLKNVSNFS